MLGHERQPPVRQDTGSTLLQAVDLVKLFGSRRVVDHVSLTVPLGKVTGLIGPSGSGKSTVFEIIAGTIRPDSGRVLLGATDISTAGVDIRSRIGIGYLPQAPQLFAAESVASNLMVAIEALTLDKASQNDRLQRLLSAFSLEQLRDSRLASLSGGERRRCEIAYVVATRPRYILLDEPFSGVDPLIVQSLRDLIRRLANAGAGVLVTDHNARETLATVDHAHIIDEGIIIAEGSKTEVARDPVVRDRYLGQTYEL